MKNFIVWLYSGAVMVAWAILFVVIGTTFAVAAEKEYPICYKQTPAQIEKEKSIIRKEAKEERMNKFKRIGSFS